jgi:formylglycine-generating enzyme required for sulfatase activity
MRKKLLVFWVLFFALVFLKSTFANNITVSNLSLDNLDSASGTVEIKFDLDWENSFSPEQDPDATTFDAAWVFVKFYSGDPKKWHHARLSEGGTFQLYSTETKLGITEDRVGVFCRPGNNQTLIWNYRDAGVSLEEEDIKIKVFAIEMVYIPEGEFYIGSGMLEAYSFYDASDPTRSQPIKITASSPWLSDRANGAEGTGIPGDIAFNKTTSPGYGNLPVVRTQLNPNYPTGYKGFYIAKYPISQGQYRDFLNTLTREEQHRLVGKTISDTNASFSLPDNIPPGTTEVTNVYVMENSPALTRRVSIRCDSQIDAYAPVTFYCDLNGNGIPNEEDDGEWLPMSDIWWHFNGAFCDWAGLRPITELEYEKACRGPVYPVPGELAHGLSNVNYLSVSAAQVGNPGRIDEYATNNGNFRWIYGTSWIMRVGFAATPNSTRESAISSYYGVMDMTSQVSTPVVSVVALTFDGQHGDGELDASVNTVHNVPNWPTDHAGWRSGDRNYVSAVSYRYSDSNLDPLVWKKNRTGNSSIRPCRTAY